MSGSVANFITDGANNFYGYSDKKVDKWLKQVQVSTSEDEANALLAKVEAQLVKDAFGTVIFQFPSLTAWNTKVTNIQDMPIGVSYYWNFWQWDVK